MKRVSSDTQKHNKLIRDTIYNSTIRDMNKRNKAAQREAKENSLDYKLTLAQRQSVQHLYKPEKNYDLLIKKGIVDDQTLNDAENEIIKAIEVAAIQSLGRIIAEIKTKSLNLNDMIDIQISKADFYNNFEDFYNKNFGELKISKDEFTKIINPYININLTRIKTIGKRFKYLKAANKLESNICHIEKVAVNNLEPRL